MKQNQTINHENDSAVSSSIGSQTQLKKQDYEQKKLDKEKNKAAKREKSAALKKDKADRKKQAAEEKKHRKQNQKLISKEEKKELRRQEKQRLRREHEEKLPMCEKLKLIAKEQSTDADWVNLDNAALIFPAAENADKSNMFRLSVLLKEPVDPIILQKALNETVPRFPTITSAVKYGLFWYYLEPSSRPLVAQEQTDFPMRKIPLDSRHALIRVTYFGNEISVEYFHVATDGTGGITYLNSLVGCYLRLKGFENDGTNCPDTRDRPRPEELVDSFQTMFDHTKKGENKAVKAYNYRCKRLPATALILTKGVMTSDEIGKASKSKNATVTEFATAALIWAINEDRILLGRDKKKPIVISVPVNLRRLYPSKSLRNFVSMMAIVHNGERDFDSILEDVKRQFKEQYSTEFFNKLVGLNVNLQHNPFIKILPLPLKDVALKTASVFLGDRSRTLSFSNLGKISAPKEFEEHIIRYEFSLGPQVREGFDLAAASFNGTCVFTFSKTIKETNIERFFFSKIAEYGVKIALETNFEL